MRIRKEQSYEEYCERLLGRMPGSYIAAKACLTLYEHCILRKSRAQKTISAAMHTVNACRLEKGLPQFTASEFLDL